MTKQNDIDNTIEPVIRAMGYEFVGSEFFSQGRYSTLKIFIDQEEGVTVDDCAKVSGQIGALLDVEDLIAGKYNLEVSSPGLDRPLFTLEHFKRFIGAQVTLRVNVPIDGRRNFKGLLKNVDQNDVILVVDNEEFRVPFESVAKANLVYGD